MPTVSREIEISNSMGLHARPAMRFVDLANQFKSQVRVKALSDEPIEADGKSIMEMMMLAAVPGTLMRITASGDDADSAVDKLCELVANKFFEE